ncbi:MAG: phenylalanine--tRNA ligase subunit alpha [Crocinitomicaceae bacterium]|jgi:phenylalanyl-tRNA synthetase alpha chain|nr:phenylalanine--tRNA ligase subunit alpha [Crocinitomicaceae bacterium]
MREKIEHVEREISGIVLSTKQEAEAFRIQYLGSKGVLKSLYQEFKTIGAEEKKEIGQRLNELKQRVEQKLSEISWEETGNQEKNKIDLTRPGKSTPLGSLHPLTMVRNELIQIFSKIGFSVSEGPEIEDDWHNFSALNFPPDHPARDMQDTFFIESAVEGLSLRTHTSSVQVRVMENQKPPIRTISPGRVYRNEAISARAHCFFHQVEGLYIDKNVSFADLKQTLDYFAKSLFGETANIRLRPSYFPFTEPSAEVDVSCSLCQGTGCGVCKHTGWLEILGCGMVDPNVLDACGIDSTVYSGFAFGMGVERIAQLKYRVTDLRLYSENDVRFLNQFHF